MNTRTALDAGPGYYRPGLGLRVSRLALGASQKLAYTTALALGAVVAVTGLALYKPVQLSWLVQVLGGFRLVRVACRLRCRRGRGKLLVRVDGHVRPHTPNASHRHAKAEQMHSAASQANTIATRLSKAKP